MSSNQNKGKGKGKWGKGGNKGQREETAETKLPEAKKEETPSDPISQDGIQSDVQTQKEETPTSQEETTNTDISHREESSLTREGHAAEGDHREVEVAAVQSKEPETVQIPPKVEEPTLVLAKPETAETIIQAKEAEVKPTEQPQQQFQTNVEPSEIRELHSAQIKVEERYPQEEIANQQRETTEFEIISSGDFTKVTHLDENVERQTTVEANHHQESVQNHQQAHQQPVHHRQAVVEDVRDEPNPYLTTQILVQQNQNTHIEEQNKQEVPAETTEHRGSGQKVENNEDIREETSQVHQRVRNQSQQSVEVPPHEVQERPRGQHHSQELLKQQSKLDGTEVRRAQPAESVDPIAHPEQPNVSSPEPHHDHHEEHTSEHKQLEKIESQEEEHSKKLEVATQRQEVIDLNKPMDEDSPKKKKTEQRIFRLVESKEISVSESNQISVEGSLQMKGEVKVPVKSSISFSDLNYSVERSVNASQEQERILAVRPDRIEEHVSSQQSHAQEQINSAPAPQEVDASQTILVSQPIAILQESVSNSNASEIFYSIVQDEKIEVNGSGQVEVEKQIEPEAIAEPDHAIASPQNNNIIIVVNHHLAEPQIGESGAEKVQVALEPVEIKVIHQAVPDPVQEEIEPVHAHNEPVHVDNEPVLPAQRAVEPVPEPNPVEKVDALEPNNQPVEDRGDQKDPSEQLQPKEPASSGKPAVPVEEQKQIDPADLKPESSVLKKLIISTAVGSVAGGAFYWFKSSKAGSLMLGLASLAVTYLAA